MPSDKYELKTVEDGSSGETPRDKRDGSPESTDSGVENAAYTQSTDTVSNNDVSYCELHYLLIPTKSGKCDMEI